MKRNKHSFDVTEEGLEMDGAFIAPFYPVLKEKRLIRALKSKKERKEYDICAKLADGRELSTHTFAAIDNIKYFETWDECCDAELTSSAKKGLLIYLQQQITAQKPVVCFEAEGLGLCTVEPAIFIYGYKKAVAPNGINLSFSSKIPAIPAGERQENIQELLRYAKRLITLRPGITDVLFFVGVLSVLRPLLEETGCPADFFVGVFEASGTQKTTYVKLLQIFR